MRTMFIVLILWLAVFTTADPPPTRPVHEECGETFSCYVPETCVPSPPSPRPLLSASRVVEVKNGGVLFDDCEAMIRFHQYSIYWVHVEIESFATAVKSIVFDQKDDQELIYKFSCEKDTSNGNPKAKWEAKYGPKMDVHVIMENNPTKLLCKYQVKLKESDKVFTQDTTHKIQFKIDTDQSVPTDNLNICKPGDNLECDPSRLDYTEDETSIIKLYAKVKYDGYKYKCDNFYTMEYRAKSTDDFVKADLKCFRDKFWVNSVKIAKDNLLDIRCVADAHFFCNDPVQSPAETSIKKKPIPTPADIDTMTPSKLECPSTHPHIIYRNQPIPDLIFKCLNYGARAYWTVSGRRITKHGPEVYCTNQLKCHLLHTISQSAVEGGIVDENFLPACLGKDQLLTGGKNVNRTWCESKSGEFKYAVEGDAGELIELTIHNTTQFVCNHEEESKNDEKKDKENESKMINGSLIGGGVAVVLLLLAAGIGFHCMLRRQKKAEKEMKEKALMEDNDRFLKYGATAAEKRAYKLSKPAINKPLPSSSSGDEKKVKLFDWKEMIMTMRLNSWSVISTSDEDGGHIAVVPEKALVFSHTPELSKKNGPTYKIEQGKNIRTDNDICKGVAANCKFFLDDALVDLKKELNPTNDKNK